MRKNEPMAGGVFVALGAIIGVIAGKLQGQPSLGLILGLALGSLIAVIVWRSTRGR